MDITEAPGPEFDQSNIEVKQLYSDYKEKLCDLYLRVYEKSRRDMTGTSHGMYAAIETVFQTSLPNHSYETSMGTDKAIHYIKVFVRALMQEDEYSAVLAVTKFIRHKQISLISSVRLTEKDILDSIPESLKRFCNGRVDMEKVVKDSLEKVHKNFKVINDGINELIDMVEQYYPWDKLDTEKLLAWEYNIPLF